MAEREHAWKRRKGFVRMRESLISLFSIKTEVYWLYLSNYITKLASIVDLTVQFLTILYDCFRGFSDLFSDLSTWIDILVVTMMGIYKST